MKSVGLQANAKNPNLGRGRANAARLQPEFDRRAHVETPPGMQPWGNQGPARRLDQMTGYFRSFVAQERPLGVLNDLSDSKGYRNPKNDIYGRYEQDGPAKRPPLIGLTRELLLAWNNVLVRRKGPGCAALHATSPS